MRKKLRRLSTTRWCPAALDFLDATVRFLQQGPRALIPQHVLRVERPVSIASPCATRRPALGLLPGTRLASTYYPPRCGLLRDGPHGAWHPGQIFLAYSRFSHLLKRNKTWDTSGWAQRVLVMHAQHGSKPPIPEWLPFDDWTRSRRDKRPGSDKFWLLPELLPIPRLELRCSSKDPVMG